MSFFEYITTLFSRQKTKFLEENKLTDIYDVNHLITNAYSDDRFQRFCDSNPNLLERNKFLLLLAREMKQEEETKQNKHL